MFFSRHQFEGCLRVSVRRREELRWVEEEISGETAVQKLFNCLIRPNYVPGPEDEDDDEGDEGDEGHGEALTSMTEPGA